MITQEQYMILRDALQEAHVADKHVSTSAGLTGVMSCFDPVCDARVKALFSAVPFSPDEMRLITEELSDAVFRLIEKASEAEDEPGLPDYDLNDIAAMRQKAYILQRIVSVIEQRQP